VEAAAPINRAEIALTKAYQVHSIVDLGDADRLTRQRFANKDHAAAPFWS